MSLAGNRIACGIVRKDSAKLPSIVARSSSTSHTPATTTDARPPKDVPLQSSNPILHVQTYSGIRNMAYGLYILRAIEKKYGPIESYLFPRESGTNEYHPTFYFKFRDPNSYKALERPFTRLDLTAVDWETQPNHTIDLNQIRHLIWPTADATQTKSRSPEADPFGSIVKETESRFKPRIGISDRSEYPVPSFTHKTINPQDKPRIERALASWIPAAEKSWSQSPPEAPRKSILEVANELLRNHPDTPAAPRKSLSRATGEKDTDNASDGGEQDSAMPVAPADHRQLFKVHSRKNFRRVPDSHGPSASPSNNTEARFEDDPSSGSSPVINKPIHTLPKIPEQFGSKRLQQLSQMRLAAAAAKAQSISKQQQMTEEENRKKMETESEARSPAPQKGHSIWCRFLGR